MNKIASLERITLISVIAATVAVFPFLMDPIIIIKLFILSVGSFFLILKIVFNWKQIKIIIFSNRLVFYLLLIYVCFNFISAFFTNQDTYRTFFGSWGRNNGLLATLFLALIFLAASMFSAISTLEEILNSLFYLGLLYSTYAWLQFYGKDPITLILPWWKKPGEPIMLTLGNSNFASILLAMTFSGTLVKFIKSGFTKPSKYISCISIFSHFLLIRKIDTQGKIAFAVGFFIIIFALLFYSRNRLLRIIGAFWGVGGVFTGTFGVLALFNIGFFADLLSDNIRALQDRYYTWLAAIEMMKDFPLFGIGVDNFKDEYRKYRLPISYELQTGQPFVDFDNAHSLFFQIGATLGLPVLVIFLLLIIAISIRGIMSLTTGQNKLVTSGLISIWFIYLINSFVSIDNLALSVWGWLSAGALVRMSSNDSIDKLDLNLKIKTTLKNRVISSILIVCSLLPSITLIPVLLNENRIYRLISKLPQLQLDIDRTIIAESLFSEAQKTNQIGLKLLVVDYLGYAKFYEEAEILAYEVVKDQPNSFSARILLAKSLDFQGKFEEAIPVWKKTIELDPLNESLKIKLAESLAKSEPQQ